MATKQGTMVADTVRARGNFPVAYGSEINISETDSRTIPEALGDAGQATSKTNRGVMQVGDGLDVTDSTSTTPGLVSVHKATEEEIGGVTIGDGVSVDEGEISVPFYATVSSEEPEDKSKLWIDTSGVYNPTGEEIPISEEDGNAIIAKSDGLYVQDNIYSTDEIRVGTWIDGKPLYRRVYRTTSTSLSGTTYKISCSNNIKEVINLFGTGNVTYYSNSFILPFIFAHPNSLEFTIALQYLTSSKELCLIIGSGYTVTSYNIVIEYTKTTD